MPLAEIALQALEASKRPQAERVQTLAAGLAATRMLLEQSPGWPRAMALQAALLWTGRDLLSRDLAQRGQLAQVNTLFRDAFAGNALLRNRYGEMAKEAAARMKD
jgi:hypothetical protein